MVLSCSCTNTDLKFRMYPDKPQGTNSNTSDVKVYHTDTTYYFVCDSCCNIDLMNIKWNLEEL